jgi:hypothetical protein
LCFTLGKHLIEGFVLSQTSTSITVEVTIEPINGVIDAKFSYKGLALDFRGSDDFSISVSLINEGLLSEQ